MTDSALTTFSTPQHVVELAKDILDQLDESPLIQTVEEVVGRLFATQNFSQWTIGNILVFMRYKPMFKTVDVLRWQGEPENVPGHVLDSLAKLTGKRHINFPEPEEFVFWQVFKMGDIWVLKYSSQDNLPHNEFRIWKRNEEVFERGDDDFDIYMRELEKRLRSVIEVKSLSSYYRTALCFPPSQQGRESWTFHYELVNLTSKQIPSELSGEDRIREHRKLTRLELERRQQMGDTRVESVRATIADRSRRRRGFTWWLPPQKAFYIRDAVNQEIYPVIEFYENVDPEITIAMLVYAGMLKANMPKVFHLTWDHEDLIDDRSGEKVARIVNQDKSGVAQALVTLSTKMGWKVKR